MVLRYESPNTTTRTFPALPPDFIKLTRTLRNPLVFACNMLPSHLCPMLLLIDPGPLLGLFNIVQESVGRVVVFPT